MKSNIYRIWILAVCLLSGTLMNSCSDDGVSNDLPKKIDIHTAVQLTPIHGGVDVDWIPDPEDANFVFLHIEFTDQDGAERRYSTSRFNSNLVVPETTDDDGNKIPNNNQAASVQISNLINQQYTLHLYGFNDVNNSIYLGNLEVTPLDYKQCAPDSIYAVNVKPSRNNTVTLEWKELPMQSGSTLEGIRFIFTNVKDGTEVVKEYAPGIRHDEFQLEKEGIYAVTYGTYSAIGKEWKRTLEKDIEVEIAPSIEYWTKDEKVGWTITGCTEQTEYENGRFTNMLDGEAGTYWHSAWAPNDGELPHHFIVNIKKPMHVKSCLFQQRNQADRQVTEIAIYVKEKESDSWGEAVYKGPLTTGTNDACVKQTIELTTRGFGQFIKVETIAGTGGNFHCMAEFGIVARD